MAANDPDDGLKRIAAVFAQPIVPDAVIAGEFSGLWQKGSLAAAWALWPFETADG